MSDQRKEDHLSNSQLIQQLALLSWLQTDSVQSKDLLTVVTGVQVAQEILCRLTGKDQVDVYKEECILAIADYVKSHPRASQQEINRHVEKQVLLFAARVQALDSAPLC